MINDGLSSIYAVNRVEFITFMKNAINRAEFKRSMGTRSVARTSCSKSYNVVRKTLIPKARESRDL